MSRRSGLLSLLVRDPLIVALGGAFMAGLILLGVQLHGLSSDLVRHAAQRDAERYSDAIATVRSLYTSKVVSRARENGIEVTHDYAEREGAIPLPATLTIEIGRALARADDGSWVRLYSDHPFPWREQTGGPSDDFERSALAALRETPDTPVVRFELLDGHPVVRYAVADRLRDACVDCHNGHPDSPKRDWKVGDVRGVLEVIRPLDSLAVQTESRLASMAATAAVLALICLTAFSLLARRLRPSPPQ